MDKGKKERAKGADKWSKEPARGTSAFVRTSDKETFLGDVEFALVEYLKQLGSLPSHSVKKDDPLTRKLQTYAKKWREVKK
ncbi:MAG: hypothetical protein ACFE95_07095 [Candidatus Hodarchaeota archaeon]